MKTIKILSLGSLNSGYRDVKLIELNDKEVTVTGGYLVKDLNYFGLSSKKSGATVSVFVIPTDITSFENNLNKQVDVKGVVKDGQITNATIVEKESPAENQEPDNKSE